MAGIARDAVEGALGRKGFVQEPGKDHRYYRLHVNGKKSSICTKVSTGKKYKDLGDDLVTSMARQVKLTTPQFRQLVECSIDGDAYLALLCGQGIEF